MKGSDPSSRFATPLCSHREGKHLSLLKQLFYGILISHHVKKANKYSDYAHLTTYHFQLTCYYYEKAYGVKFKDEKEVMTMLRKL